MYNCKSYTLTLLVLYSSMQLHLHPVHTAASRPSHALNARKSSYTSSPTVYNESCRSSRPLHSTLFFYRYRSCSFKVFVGTCLSLSIIASPVWLCPQVARYNSSNDSIVVAKHGCHCTGFLSSSAWRGREGQGRGSRGWYELMSIVSASCNGEYFPYLELEYLQFFHEEYVYLVQWSIRPFMELRREQSYKTPEYFINPT
jgi:hypothetical protein